ncbi:sodium:calcium antiporter [Geomicrobium sp. JCM 19039]|uniref:sodium:calcium antiporter n=1 Tax=Geomicrobium sp. JCM 19039 TaxID=1460636 RepID=UPI00045F29B8|nr:sodium:calcium antiporter [Geomicrobium sp. JCM 19039]GAK11856.1 cation antiporter [Geomicrobium sp. JCM 19039]
MVFIWFIIAVIVTVLAAVKISTYADAISRLSSFGSLLIGTFLLAGATSLPEVTTSITAVYLDNPDMAVGNVLGSNIFNIGILAAFLLIYRKKLILSNVDRQQQYTAYIGLAMTVIVVLALFFTIEIPLLNIGIESLLLLLLYGLNIWVLQKTSGAAVEEHDDQKDDYQEEKYTLKGAMIGFIIAAVIILISGTVLTFAGDQIAVITGLGSSFVGSFLIATTTSLPEVVTVYVALSLNNRNLAAASILGSNLFNLLILSVCDFLYDGSILQAASMTNIVTGIILLVNSIAIAGAIYVARNYRERTWPAIVIILLYFVAVILMYVFR